MSEDRLDKALEAIKNEKVTPEELARIDRLTEKYGLSRSQFLRNLLVVGLDECEAMEKFGILRAALTVRDIQEWMASKLKPVSEHIDKDTTSKA